MCTDCVLFYFVHPQIQCVCVYTIDFYITVVFMNTYYLLFDTRHVSFASTYLFFKNVIHSNFCQFVTKLQN